MTLALLCSGQGRQDRDTFSLFEDEGGAAPILEAAGALLGRDLRALLRDGAAEELHNNRTGQILCTARALAAASCLVPPEPFLVAGYSVGEMAAWGIAGIWSAEETLRLTARRAELMDGAGGAEDGLGFVRGLARSSVERLLPRFRCALAIVNPGRLHVVGGGRSDVARFCEAALAAGAESARPLPVRVASHTPRLAAAVAPFRAVLAAAGGARPGNGRVLFGAAEAGIVGSTARGLDGLAGQLANTIDWAAVLEALVERGVRRVFELGPGTALAEMARAMDPALDIRALDDFRSVAGARRWLTATG